MDQHALIAPSQNARERAGQGINGLGYTNLPTTRQNAALRVSLHPVLLWLIDSLIRLLNSRRHRQLLINERKEHMAFVKGQSGNPAGRPKGSKHRYGLEILERNARPLLQQIIDRALGGDLKALEICADRLWPKVKPTSKTVELQVAGSLGDQGQEVLKAAITGQIGTDEANALMATLTAQAKLLEVSELITRVEALEQFRGVQAPPVIIEKIPRKQLLTT
jgi:hypothetical protein